jgi:hypothetical protein
VLRNVFGPKREDESEGWTKHLEDSRFILPTKCYSDGQIKQHKMPYGGKERYTQDFEKET